MNVPICLLKYVFQFFGGGGHSQLCLDFATFVKHNYIC